MLGLSEGLLTSLHVASIWVAIPHNSITGSAYTIIQFTCTHTCTHVPVSSILFACLPLFQLHRSQKPYFAYSLRGWSRFTSGPLRLHATRPRAERGRPRKQSHSSFMLAMFCEQERCSISSRTLCTCSSLPTATVRLPLAPRTLAMHRTAAATRQGNGTTGNVLHA